MVITCYREFLGTCIESKKTVFIQYGLYSKNSSNHLFHHIWLFSMLKKFFLICAA